MAGYNIPSSIQESIAMFANSTLASINSAVSEVAGVEVMWFRAMPDKRSQDVIFQSYTLYGVEDCPLTFKAIYTDTGYDEGAMTYNIMGINFNVPMTLDIALNTWNDATGNDGTIPQDHDIVFIPMTRKLMEVVSMTPVKAMAGQLTGYKVNLSVYKPTRSRIVGENLKTSIQENTTNLDERFGKDIEETLKDIVDDNQLNTLSSTDKDPHKTVNKKPDEYGRLKVTSIIKYDLEIDGHTVSKSYYNLSMKSKYAVKYSAGDSFTNSDGRCLSVWIRPQDFEQSYIFKNLRGNVSIEDTETGVYLKIGTGNKFSIGDSVILKRGNLVIPGTVTEKDTVKINRSQFKELSKMNSQWYNLPGFVMFKDQRINLLNGGDFSIDLRGKCAVCIKYGNDEQILRLSQELKPLQWYGLIINLGDEFRVDVFDTEDKLKPIDTIEGIKNSLYNEVHVKNYSILPSGCDMTNIRFYDVNCTEIDKQITDLVSLNVRNDSHAIINDGVGTYDDKPYIGRQR